MNIKKLKKPFKLFKKHFKHFEKNMQNKELQDAYDELQSSYHSLNNYKDLLEQKVQEEISKREIHEKILARQAKFAAMGEMMDAVAHQWSQPLSIIDMHIHLLSEDFKNGIVDNDYIDTTLNSISIQKQHLVTTLKKFRYFFNSSNTAKEFDANEMIKDVLILLKDEITRNNINIEYYDEKFKLYGCSSEIQHVLINIINNAKDAFNMQNIQKRKIKISVLEKTSYTIIKIDDNACGIDCEIIENIFKPYISTKNKNNSSGIGLYMSNLIMQKYNGKIEAKNIEGGARFLLKFYKNKD